MNRASIRPRLHSRGNSDKLADSGAANVGFNSAAAS